MNGSIDRRIDERTWKLRPRTRSATRRSLCGLALIERAIAREVCDDIDVDIEPDVEADVDVRQCIAVAPRQLHRGTCTYQDLVGGILGFLFLLLLLECLREQVHGAERARVSRLCLRRCVSCRWLVSPCLSLSRYLGVIEHIPPIATIDCDLESKLWPTSRRAATRRNAIIDDVG